MDQLNTDHKAYSLVQLMVYKDICVCSLSEEAFLDINIGCMVPENARNLARIEQPKNHREGSV